MDALLGGLDRLIAKKRDLKQAAMQQLLTGQTRLPGFHGEWEVKRMGDLVDDHAEWRNTPLSRLNPTITCTGDIPDRHATTLKLRLSTDSDDVMTLTALSANEI